MSEREWENVRVCERESSNGPGAGLALGVEVDPGVCRVGRREVQ